jgi:hypothetical protein
MIVSVVTVLEAVAIAFLLAAVLKREPTPAPAAGFAITLEKIVTEPTYKEFRTISKDQRYIALLLAIENNTGANDTLYPSQFSLKDPQGFNYDPLNLHLMPQSLEWRSMGNRETLRGYTDFIVPASAKNLTLVYPRDPQPIQIDLDE